MVTMINENKIDSETCDLLMESLIKDVPWTCGILNKNGGISRLQCNLEMCDEETQENVIDALIEFMTGEEHILSVYLNYYRDGSDYCPKHNHPGTKQMILSLGSSRQLNISDKKFILKSGTVIKFTDEYHWMYSQKHVFGSRISIVVFYL